MRRAARYLKGMSESFRIVTYNLQKCVGLDLRRRPDRILTVLAQARADLAVLQEADKRLPPRPAALPHDMAEAEGWRILPFGQPGGSLGWHGNAMLVRGGAKVDATAHLDLPGLEPRGAIRAELNTALGPLRVIGVHFGLLPRSRHLQFAAILRHLSALPPRPTVLAGDFNDWGEALAHEAARAGFACADTPATYPAPRPTAQLDRIYHSPDLAIAEAHAPKAAPARIASDHLPLVVSLRRHAG